MAEIQIDAPAGPIRAIIEVPDGEGPWPSIVVVHDAFGMSEDIGDIARRCAVQGYVAIVPDLYHRGGGKKCVVGVFRALISGEGTAVDDVLAARDHLLGRDDTDNRVGIVGFCMGGGFALLLAPRGFGASAPFYGVLPRHIDEALGDACPIVASFGQRDPTLIGAGKKLKKVLTDKGIPNDVKTYPGAGHSFANQDPDNKAAALIRVAGFGYQHEQAEDAFARVFAFFGEHLQ